jgi:hypothetical protein
VVTSLLSWLDFGVKALAILGGFMAVSTFWRTAKVRRAEWLSSLHAKFFEASSYKHIRRILDGDDGDPELSALQADIGGRKNSDLAEEFVDFLNFFEFVASLHKIGQIRRSEITMLFDYYLRPLSAHAFVRTYVKENGFEQLDVLLSESMDGRSR